MNSNEYEKNSILYLYFLITKIVEIQTTKWWQHSLLSTKLLIRNHRVRGPWDLRDAEDHKVRQASAREVRPAGCFPGTFSDEQLVISLWWRLKSIRQGENFNCNISIFMTASSYLLGLSLSYFFTRKSLPYLVVHYSPLMPKLQCSLLIRRSNCIKQMLLFQVCYPEVMAMIR